MARRPTWGWSWLLSPEERRRYCGNPPHARRDGRIPQSRAPRCCENLPRYCRRHAYLGVKQRPANSIDYTYIRSAVDLRGIPEKVIRAAMATGELRALKVRGSWWIKVADLNAWQERWERRGGRTAA